MGGKLKIKVKGKKGKKSKKGGKLKLKVKLGAKGKKSKNVKINFATFLAKTKCESPLKKMVDATKKLAPYQQWYGKQFQKCYKAIVKMRSQSVCAACYPAQGKNLV